jgi:hypothetical protein
MSGWTQGTATDRTAEFAQRSYPVEAPLEDRARSDSTGERRRNRGTPSVWRRLAVDLGVSP